MNYFNSYSFIQRYTRALDLLKIGEKFQLTLKRGCELAAKFDNFTRNEILNKWSDRYSINKKILIAYSDGNYLKLTNTEKLQEFLSHYQIFENSISRELLIKKDGTSFTLDELIIDAEENGLNTKNIKKILNPSNINITVVKVVNPLKTFFEELAKKYRGEKVIQQLALTITAYNFGNNDNSDHYTKRLEYYLHKWLCMAVGQGLGLVINNAMLLFVEPEGGSGKTFLIEWLFSLPELFKYHIKQSENSSYMDFAGIGRSKFSINWDELPLSKKRYMAFKSYITAQNQDIYNKKTKQTDKSIRQVNYIGSTNKANRNGQRGYLLDNDSAMFRRIIPIEITGKIKYLEYLNMDLTQIWAQAANDFLRAFEFNDKNLTSWECDFEDLRKENHKYIDKNSRDFFEILLQNYKPCKYGEGILMSSSQILNEIKLTGVDCSNKSPDQIGNFLSENSYISKRTSTLRGWWVKKI